MFVTRLLVALLISAISLSAQYIHQWDQYFTDHAGDLELNPIPQAAAVDYFNNVITVGMMEYGQSWYSSRYSSRGTHRWTQTFRPNIATTQYARAVCTDKNASMIITGECFNPSLDKQALTIVKYSQYGELEFNQMRNDLGGSVGNAICATRDGGFVVGGAINNRDNYTDAFVAKYNASNIEVWSNVYSRTTNSGDDVRGIMIDSEDNIIVMGVGGFGDDYGITVSKFSPYGTVLWRQVVSGGQCLLMLDSADNIYLSGRDVGFVDGKPTGYITANKISKKGEILWSKKIEHESGHFFGDAALDPQGNMVIVVRKTLVSPASHTLILCLDSDGKQLWDSEYPTSQFQISYNSRVVYDGMGSFLVAASVGNVTTSGTIDLGAVQFNLAGDVLWQGTFEARHQNNEELVDLVYDNKGSIYAVGYCTDGTGTDTRQLVVKYTARAMSTDDDEMFSSDLSCTVQPSIASNVANCVLALDRPGMVTVRVFDQLGTMVLDLGTQYREQGDHAFNIPTSSFASGTYHIVSSVDDVTSTAKFIVLN